MSYWRTTIADLRAKRETREPNKTIGGGVIWRGRDAASLATHNGSLKTCAPDLRGGAARSRSSRAR